MEVRDYELDQFQVVNNAVYASYVQHGKPYHLHPAADTPESVIMPLTSLACSRVCCVTS